MRHILAILACCVGLIGSANAQQTGTLIELYTSQGCSSCPPADHLLAQIADQDDVIALALHVDYWDYIGWKDDLAHPAYAQRQRGYAREWNAANIYTPQIVVAGTHGVVGSDPGKLMALMAKHPVSENPVTLQIERRADGLHIAAQAVGDVPTQALIQIVTVDPSVVRKIERGENAGRTIEYRNVVTDWAIAGRWATATPLAMVVAHPAQGPIVVIIQDGTAGPVLAAMKIP